MTAEQLLTGNDQIVLTELYSPTVVMHWQEQIAKYLQIGQILVRLVRYLSDWSNTSQTQVRLGSIKFTVVHYVRSPDYCISDW